MKVKAIAVSCLLMVFASCNMLYQNEFQEAIDVGEVGDKKVICLLYKTGIDNYRYEFKLVEKADTMDISELFLNDATSQNSDFELQVIDDTVNICLNKPVGQEFRELGNHKFLLKGCLN
ncbi:MULTISPECIES: hypothetical protein [unclassified Imperialibacter]|uniref:hypothetical protein n=1 Tax=unclassified Imperialibacter TaxID=2629706 RepID=UPI001255E3E6|nr:MULTISPECIES: hypothetical protein [unclassified Imperialibacter]CAD5281352.1 exported hypothetical protein [Imperialibacter sp. 89]CAD5288239.1 exported hypothetical protein [Imperialibacter sp. 75]VVT31280.1 exported hypothetical protein [Imperialibacter sp. EC-SDR9]